MHPWLTVLITMGVLVAGCAKLPLATPIADASRIAGTWTGTMTSSDGTTYEGVSHTRPG